MALADYLVSLAYGRSGSGDAAPARASGDFGVGGLLEKYGGGSRSRPGGGAESKADAAFRGAEHILRESERELDRQMRDVGRTDAEAKAVLLRLARRAAPEAERRLIAREIARGRAAMEKLVVARGHVRALQGKLVAARATGRMVSAMSDAAHVVAHLNGMSSIPRLRHDAERLRSELLRAEVMQESLDSALEDSLSPSSSSEDSFAHFDDAALDAEVDRIMREEAAKMAAAMPAAPRPAPAPISPAPVPPSPSLPAAAAKRQPSHVVPVQ
jgi:charged multivesicular body protein 3